MHLARRAWCRTYQTVFRIALPILPYTEPRILEHAEDVPAVLQKRSIQRVLIVTDPGIARLGLTAPLETALASKGIGVTVYAETRANPTVSNVEEAASLYLKTQKDTYEKYTFFFQTFGIIRCAPRIRPLFSCCIR